MIIGDMEHALKLYEDLGLRDTLLDPSNKQHIEALQQVVAAFPEAARRALDAEAGMSGPFKVWLVTAEDEWGDGVEVVRAFATKELAEQYIERFGGSRHFQQPWEWEVDAQCPEVCVRHVVALRATDGALFREHTQEQDHDEHRAWGSYWDHPCELREIIACSTQGREAALKLAREKLAELKAAKGEPGE